MYPHLYRTYINARGEGNLLELIIDLGFHVTITRVIATEKPIDPRLVYHRWVHVLVKAPLNTEYHGLDYRAVRPEPSTIQLLTGAPGEPAIQPWCQGPPELWRYPFRAQRIIDGDTIDAAIDLGFGITTVQRIRLAGIQAPELNRRDQNYGNPGHEAYRYVNRRLSEAKGGAELVSSRMGKWRRWIGIVFLPDSTETLSEELLREGLALPWNPRNPDPGPSRRMVVEVPTATKARLGEVSAAEGSAPGLLAGRIVERHLDSDYPPVRPGFAARTNFQAPGPTTEKEAEA